MERHKSRRGRNNNRAPITDKARGTEGWITRNQAADLLGFSSMSIIAWERKGRLHPKMAYRHDARGLLCEQVVYDPRELNQLPRRLQRPIAKDPDEFAARVIECFELGWGDCEIVLELRASFDKVARARQQWMDAGGATRVLTRELADGFAELVGPFETMAELLDRVRSELLSRAPARETEAA